MNDKQQILTALKEEFNRWEDLLAGLSEAQITAPHLPANLSIKFAVLKGSYVHHHEDHLEPILAWLKEHGIHP